MALTRAKQFRTPSEPGSIVQKDGKPIGILLDNPYWDGIRNATILRNGRLCKRCLKRNRVDGCYQHRVTSGAEVRIMMPSVGSKWKTDDGRIATYLSEGNVHYECP